MKNNDEKISILRQDCHEANAQVNSLHRLIEEQNEHLALLKRKTESAINEREVINKEVQIISTIC